MIITSVSGENFLQFKDIEFALNNIGLTLIQGENKDDTAADSNGAGKSSVADLMNWILWGDTARGISGDAVIRRGEKKCNGFINLRDETTKESWDITRTRTKGKETVTIVAYDDKGKGNDITAGTLKLNQENITRVIGCSEEVFRASIYIGQESLVDLPMMTDKKLKETIEEAAGVNILERCYQIAKERASEAKLNIVQMTNKLEIKKNGVVTGQHALDNYLYSRNTWLTERDGKIALLAGLVTGKEAELGTYSTSVVDLKMSTEELRRQLAEMSAKIDGLAAETKEEKRLYASCNEAERHVATKEGTLRAMLSAIKTLTQDATDLAASPPSSCPECGSEMSEEHKQHSLDSINARLTARKSEAGIARQQWEEAKGKAQACQEALEAHRKGMSDPTEIMKGYDKLNGHLNSVLGEIRTIEDIWASLDAAKKEIGALNKSVCPYDAMIEKQKENNALFEIALAEAEENLLLAEENLQIAQEVAQVYSPAGVRAHILDEVTPYLNTRTSAYLSALTDGAITATWSTLTMNAKGEVKERFAIDVEQAGGGESFAALSGGQKRKVRLACSLALQDLVASRATKPISLFIADEIDTALDTAGLERLMTVLNEKASERGTVLIISHSDLRDWISQVWNVVKKDNISILTC